MFSGFHHGLLGEKMTVVGIVTDEPHDVGSGNTLGNLQGDCPELR
jgi:hypothetical protein